MPKNLSENIRTITPDLRDLKGIKQFFFAIIHLILRKFKVLSLNDKQLYAAIKRSVRTILSNLFDILPFVVWNSLSLIEEDIIIEYFKFEATRVRRFKRRRAVSILRKVPSYVYYTAFLRRIRSLPLAMPKEVSCYKRAVTFNFTFKLNYRHKIKLDKRALKELEFGLINSKEKKKKSSKFKFVFFRKPPKNLRIKKGRSVGILSQKLVSRCLLKNKILIIGYFNISKKQHFLKKKKASVKALLFHSEQAGYYNPLRNMLKQILRNRTVFRWVKGLHIKVKKNVKRKKYVRRRRFHSQAYYRVQRVEKKKARRILKAKQKKKREKYRNWSEMGLKFWYPRAFYLNKRRLLSFLKSKVSGDQMNDIIKIFLIVAVLISSTQYIIKLYSNPVFGAVPRYVFYRKYYNWFLLQNRVGRLKWRFRYGGKIKRSRRVSFSCKDPISQKRILKEIRLKERNWFVITTKWSTRNFHLNIFSNKHQGGIFKISNGLLGAKKKNKRRFRYVRKALHYLLRFLLFYRRRMIKRQKKKFKEYYKILEKWNSAQNDKRFGQRRLFLLDTRRWIRLEKRRLTLHLIIEWFGNEDRYGFYLRFIKRLRRIQTYKLADKIGRLRKKLRRKKRQYRKNYIDISNIRKLIPKKMRASPKMLKKIKKFNAKRKRKNIKNSKKIKHFYKK